MDRIIRIIIDEYAKGNFSSEKTIAIIDIVTSPQSRFENTQKDEQLKAAFIKCINEMLDQLEKAPYVDTVEEGIDKIEVGTKIFQLQIKLESDLEGWLCPPNA